MRSICLLGVKVAVEGKGWMALAIDNYDSTGRRCSRADKRLTRVSFSFVKKRLFG